MALTTIYKKPLNLKYRSPSCSVAMLFHCLTVCAIVVIPALVGFYTRNFWVGELTYTEQPDVQFKYKMLVFLKDSGGDTHVWSTYSTFNTLAQDMLAVPSVSVAEDDEDRDGKVDQFNITLQFDKSDITSVQILLIFQYQLKEFCSLVMETPIFIQKTLDDQGLVVFGDLILEQHGALQPHNIHTQYDTSLIEDTDVLQSYDVAQLLSAVSARTLTTKLNEVYSATVPSAAFTASYIVNIRQQHIGYEPGFWEAMKYAWIQYLALLVIVHHIICRVRSFLFENMIVTTLRHDNVKIN